MRAKSVWWLLEAAIFLNLACGFRRDDQKVAEVDGTVISRSEVERLAGKSLSDVRQQLYKIEQEKLDQLITATLLTREAKKRATSIDSLLSQEVNSKIPPISEEEIRVFYQTNKARLPVELSKIHDQIRDHLKEEKIAVQKALYLKTLRANSNIVKYLKPPPVYRAELAYTGAPSRGAEKASVTIVKFEDFECPFCKSVQPTLAAVLKKYDGKVRLVHKDLPLEQIHPQAQLAAEAARCAGEQGKFWDYHDTLYRNSPKLSAAELKGYAKQIGLNASPFDQCLASGKYKVLVQKDLSEGAQLGLTGTPSFFINGREMSGALPVESFAAIIDEELGQAN
jgi:protein-disulfide isomerase